MAKCKELVDSLLLALEIPGAVAVAQCLMQEGVLPSHLLLMHGLLYGSQAQCFLHRSVHLLRRTFYFIMWGR